MASSKRNITVTKRARSVRVPRKAIVELVDFIARREKLALGELDVAVVGSAEMARLNRRHLGHAGTTDVLSFDLSGSADRLDGQVIVCSDVARREARKRGLRFTHELLRYVAHGLLHLCGYDDATAPQFQRMHARQEQLLEAFLRG
jgi:rRNA maturation RNase YbeY